jgi:hypothetical protein
MITDTKNKIDSLIAENKSLIRANDPIIKFIKKDQIGIHELDFGLRILPIELVENYGARILQDLKEYNKYKKAEYNLFQAEWERHYEQYWNDKLHLLKMYFTPYNNSASPFEVYNNLNNQMIKIERRACLLNPDPKIVEQKQHRISGETKEYTFIRSYWVDDKGEKKRMISRHVGNRYDKVEEEVGNLFHFNGFAVHRQVRVNENNTQRVFDIVVEREGMKMVVELKDIKGNKKLFHELLMFDELLRRFDEDYPNE